MKLSTYVLMIAIAIAQWLVMQLSWITPLFDATTFLLGNIQMIMIIAVYQFASKDLKLS